MFILPDGTICVYKFYGKIANSSVDTYNFLKLLPIIHVDGNGDLVLEQLDGVLERLPVLADDDCGVNVLSEEWLGHH